ncbi:MAG: TIGR01777 family oxidoreductase [Propionibacteriaceae bacterium]|nr:TIGR01777 family oxidoreductase [Propionibacteriaceae bacterium]
METFEAVASLPHPAREVFDWHRRPGALTRLSPPWAMRVIAEASPPMATGAVARLRTVVPRTGGLGWVHFDARHEAGPEPSSFIDRMVRGPFRLWEHTHLFREADGCHVIDRVNWLAPFGVPARMVEAQLPAIFEARTLRLRRELDHAADLTRRFPGQLRVLIAGASGLIGTQVAALFSTLGHQVRRLVRRAPRDDEARWDPDRGELSPSDVAWADVVMHLGGATIGRRHTEYGKKLIRQSRIDSTRLLADVIGQLSAQDRPDVFVCASAMGVYGAQRPGEELSEDSPTGTGFLAEVCRAWEREAARVEEVGVRWVSIRSGVVLSTLGGTLPLQLPLFLAGLGGVLGNPAAHLPWISLDDVARVYVRAALDPALSGPVNAVAPTPATQGDYASTLARLCRRPAWLPVPRLGPRLLLGSDGAKELAFADQLGLPTRLEAVGFNFTHPGLEDALRETTGLGQLV